MNIVHDILAGPALKGPIAMTIGSFDGVHLGHRALLEVVRDKAKNIGAETALLTLDPHPQQFFRPDDPPVLLTSRKYKEELLSDLGLDHLIYLPFNGETSKLSREQFLNDILLTRCGMKSIVIGHDFKFGKGAAGDFTYLQECAKESQFNVEEFPPFCIEGERVSSTLVRELLAQGDVSAIPKFLGRPHRICGVVTSGRGMGRQLGFPTANLAHENAALPLDGIYAASALIDDSREVIPAAVNIGFAPTLGTHDRIVEAHLLDFDGDLVGKRLLLQFGKRLRGEQTFDGKDSLIAAIQQDVESVRQFFQIGNKSTPSRFNTN